MKNSYWRKLSNIGITPGIDEQHVKRIRILNQLVASLELILAGYSIFFLLYGFKWLGVTLAIAFAILMFSFYLTHTKQYILAKLWFVALLNTLLLLYSWSFGRDSSVHLVFFSAGIMPMVLFEPRKWGYIIACAATSIIFCFTAEIFFEKGNMDIGDSMTTLLHFNAMGVVFLLNILTISHFFYQSQVLENRLSRGNNILKEKEKALNEALATSETARWKIARLSLFSDIFQEHTDNLHQLCDAVLAKLIESVGAVQGGIFLQEEDLSIIPYATHAYDTQRQKQKILRPGEGLVGQSVASGERFHLRGLPSDFYKVVSATVAAQPNEAYIFPLQYAGRNLGAIELSTFAGFSKKHTEFLNTFSTAFAVAINNTSINAHNKELLDKMGRGVRHA